MHTTARLNQIRSLPNSCSICTVPTTTCRFNIATCSPKPSSIRGRKLSISPSAIPPSNTNLGELAQLAKPLSPDTDIPPHHPSSFDPTQLHGIIVDVPAIFGSSVLLLVLLFFVFDRILGLDRILAKWTKDWQDRRTLKGRTETVQAREELEKQFDDSDGTGTGTGSDDGGSGI